jgi:hypothetical protein
LPRASATPNPLTLTHETTLHIVYHHAMNPY